MQNFACPVGTWEAFVNPKLWNKIYGFTWCSPGAESRQHLLVVREHVTLLPQHRCGLSCMLDMTPIRLDMAIQHGKGSNLWSPVSIPSLPCPPAVDVECSNVPKFFDRPVGHAYETAIHTIHSRGSKLFACQRGDGLNSRLLLAWIAGSHSQKPSSEQLLRRSKF